MLTVFTRWAVAVQIHSAQLSEASRNSGSTVFSSLDTLEIREIFEYGLQASPTELTAQS